MSEFLRTSKCPICFARAIITEWLPGAGIDKRFRKFRCLDCRLEFYKLLSEKVIKKLNIPSVVEPELVSGAL